MENVEAGARRRHGGLAEAIKRELESITNPAPNYTMLRLPQYIKQSNPEAYKPRLISIGPLHHGLPELLPMEPFKKKLAHNLIQNFSIDIQSLIDITEQYEEQLRHDYGVHSSEIPSPEFLKIMLIDGAFLVEFLLKPHFGRKWDKVLFDLLLLENQIPLYYLRQVVTFASDRLDLVELMDHFARATPLGFVVRPGSFSRESKHLLDSLRLQIGITYKSVTNRGKHPRNLPITTCPTVSKLHRAGIKFRPNQYGKISFQRGIFEIPKFTIGPNTKRYMYNLLAMEVFQDKDCYATEYIAFLEYLIDRPEDVQILVRNGILWNFLEGDKAAADLINEVGKFIDVPPDFHFSGLVEDLIEHCEKRWVRWKSTHVYDWMTDLKRNYFKSPWTILSVIAAIILLGLTVIQTVCSLLQLKG